MNTEVIKARLALTWNIADHVILLAEFGVLHPSMIPCISLFIWNSAKFQYSRIKKVIGIFVIVEILIRYLIYVKKVKSS